MKIYKNYEDYAEGVEWFNHIFIAPTGESYTQSTLLNDLIVIDMVIRYQYNNREIAPMTSLENGEVADDVDYVYRLVALWKSLHEDETYKAQAFEDDLEAFDENYEGDKLLNESI